MADPKSQTTDPLLSVRLRPGEELITISQRETAEGYVITATFRLPRPANVKYVVGPLPPGSFL